MIGMPLLKHIQFGLYADYIWNRFIFIFHDRNLLRVLTVDEMEKQMEKEKKLDAEKNAKPADETIHYWKAFKRILTLAKPEGMMMTLATISAVIIGASLPLFAILFGEVYGVS